MLAMIFVKRHAGIGDPSVGLQAGRIFAGTEMQFRGEAPTTQKKIERHSLLETIGAQEKMPGRRREEARDMPGLGQTRCVRFRYGRCHESIQQIFPAAKTYNAKSGPRGGKTNGRFEDGGSIGTTELCETPACRDGAHGSSMDGPWTEEHVRGLAKTVLQAETELMFRRTKNYSSYSWTVRAFIRFVDADDRDGHNGADGKLREMRVCQH